MLEIGRHMHHVFIGHDEREQAAWDVCSYSIQHYQKDAFIRAIAHRPLRKRGLFWREWRLDAAGQYSDVADGKPFSTQFSHSRFLAPLLAKDFVNHPDWVLFVDCDFLFRADIAELFALADPSKAVMVVKHDHRPQSVIKMDDCKQIPYPRKNWSSLILFNVNHPANARLTPECVSTADGSWLHQFGWLEDEQIGELPADWNHLIGYTPDIGEPKAVHFTEGGPWFETWPESRFDDEWRTARYLMLRGATDDAQAAIR